MSGDSAFVSLWEGLRKAASETEELGKRLRGFQVPKPPHEIEELREKVDAFNKNVEVLSSRFVTLKELIGEYRDQNFTGPPPGAGGPLTFSVSSATPSHIYTGPNLEDFQDWILNYQGDFFEFLLEVMFLYAGHKFQKTEIARKHIEGRILPELINRRRNQDEVALYLKVGTKILVQLYDEDPKAVGELLGGILKKLLESIGDQAQSVLKFVGDQAQDVWERIAELFDSLLDLLSVLLAGMIQGAEVAIDAVGSVLAQMGPAIGKVLEANGGQVAVLAGGLLLIVSSVLERRGYKAKEKPDSETDQSN